MRCRLGSVVHPTGDGAFEGNVELGEGLQDLDEEDHEVGVAQERPFLVHGGRHGTGGQVKHHLVQEVLPGGKADEQLELSVLAHGVWGPLYFVGQVAVAAPHWVRPLVLHVVLQRRLEVLLDFYKILPEVDMPEEARVLEAIQEDLLQAVDQPQLSTKQDCQVAPLSLGFVEVLDYVVDCIAEELLNLWNG